MQTLAVDGRMGASGDMLLGALLAAGADRKALKPVESALGLSYHVRRVDRAGVEATAVDVRLHDGQAAGSEGRGKGDEGRDHGHGQEHDHDEHVHSAGDGSAEGRGPHRRYGEVIELVEDVDLPAAVESNALAVFELLGEAESAVHGTDLAETYFHEVGADDAVADVVGTCLLLADLDVERVVATPVSAGGGEVTTSHGTYPVPPPAVVELAERAGWQLEGGPVEHELLTPTGAAILAHLADGVDALPPMRVSESGYGAGSRDVEGRPNVLRAVVGEAGDALTREAITVLETNVDDVTPEILGGLQETLAGAGALDVSVLPTTTKKSRPGHLIRVVTHPTDAERVAERLARETGTLGVREHGAGHRWVADREVVTATVEVGGQAHEVDVKVASAGGEVFDRSAEFDDALAVARETGEPVRDVMGLAEDAVSE